MRVSDLIRGALRKLAVIDPSEDMSPSDAATGFEALNSMLDSWSLERLFVYDVQRQTFVLTPAQQSYTIGAGGNFNTTRPNRIDAAGLITVGSSDETPLDVLTDQRYQSIVQKTQAGDPGGIWYEEQYPLGKIYPWPVADKAHTLALYTWIAVSQFAALGSTISLPPGYERALRYNLALELAPEYGVDVSPKVEEIASESKSNIKTINYQPQELRCDDALMPRRRNGVFNPNTGNIV
jgi:hypothetical protein